MKSKKNRLPWKLLAFLLLVIVLGYAFSEKLRVVHYTVETPKVSSSVRLAVLTDLHESYYGEKQSWLIAAVDAVQPDAICFVGDIFDTEGPHTAVSDLLDGIASIYPCYFVTGNHEFSAGRFSDLCSLLERHGVTMLRGDTAVFSANGQTITICGIDDPIGVREGEQGTLGPDTWQGQLSLITESVRSNPYFSVLLAHRPERIEEYTAVGADLILSGHTHGGQVRIPLVLNGLFAHNQGYFPKYAGGQYPLGSTTLLISRGLCKNNLPRIFNRPELVIVDILPSVDA